MTTRLAAAAATLAVAAAAAGMVAVTPAPARTLLPHDTDLAPNVTVADTRVNVWIPPCENTTVRPGHDTTNTATRSWTIPDMAATVTVAGYTTPGRARDALNELYAATHACETWTTSDGTMWEHAEEPASDVVTVNQPGTPDSTPTVAPTDPFVWLISSPGNVYDAWIIGTQGRYIVAAGASGQGAHDVLATARDMYETTVRNTPLLDRTPGLRTVA